MRIPRADVACSGKMELSQSDLMHCCMNERGQQCLGIQGLKATAILRGFAGTISSIWPWPLGQKWKSCHVMSCSEESSTGGMGHGKSRNHQNH